MDINILYFFAGALGGFFGGLLGLGGGIIFVPFLFFIFSQYGIHSSHIMQSAICTSLACIIVSSISSTYKHNINKLVDWNLFKKMFLGLILGAASGILIISFLSSNHLKFYYGLFLIILSFYILLSNEKVMAKKPFQFAKLFSFFAGNLSSILGIGGGTITTPYFKFFGKSIKESIATAAACGIPIAISGVITSVLLNLKLGILENEPLGFIHVESFIIIAITSIIFSYLGATVTYLADIFFIRFVFSGAVLVMGLVIILA